MNYDQRKDRIITEYKKAKEEKLRLQERQKVCLEEMKKEFMVESAEELKALIDDARTKIQKLEAKINPALTKLEADLDL